jgi:hypothetical protein
MTTLMLVWLIALSVLLFVVYRRAEEGRAMQWRLEELRRDVETARRDLSELRKKFERGSVAA